ncbi:hypothetical protein L195_g042991 [Trifolium pratense]|uniref:Uncharacterized protein n=1 Tax=Trifolium pratense TaxID=57577 RepID=A0A2K3M804_TRIPR|nr:hypothetical protein L195_g042991 [Trifolium pratense]
MRERIELHGEDEATASLPRLRRSSKRLSKLLLLLSSFYWREQAELKVALLRCATVIVVVETQSESCDCATVLLEEDEDARGRIDESGKGN